MTDSAIDPYDLQRFVSAQQDAFDSALRELRGGRKRTHWIWFIFPQVAGLGSSALSHRYAIKSRQEASAYLQHPVLGNRLRECVEALLALSGKTAEEVMGHPDDLKLKSSMTLFAAVSPDGSVFQAVLDRYYSGDRDELTIHFLAEHENG